MTPGGENLTPPSSDDGASNQSVEQPGMATRSCRRRSGRVGPWNKELVQRWRSETLTEGELLIEYFPLWGSLTPNVRQIGRVPVTW